MLGHEAVKKLCRFEKEIIKEIGVEKNKDIQFKVVPEELRAEVTAKVDKKLRKAVSTKDKLEREEKIEAIEKETEAEYAENGKTVSAYLKI